LVEAPVTLNEVFGKKVISTKETPYVVFGNNL
jgi:hypothetical protein